MHLRPSASSAPPLLALLAELLELRLERGHALLGPALADLEGGLARASPADAAGEARERVVLHGQPRQRVLELRQLDLQPTFTRAGAPPETLQDQAGAVQHLAVQLLLELPDLCAHPGLTDVNPFCRTREVRFVSHRDEVLELT